MKTKICIYAYKSFICVDGNHFVARDEFFDVLARIKVPKIQAFRDCRSPILNDAHLAKRNSKILCPRHQIERDTPFYEQ
jgi:hypothetical protein